jgi:pimeloyl-ACP methyl ester carboxylesterase
MIFQPNLTLEELSRITIPTLVVAGENDMVSQRHSDEIHHAIKGSKRLVIPGGDHFWAFKKTGLCNQIVMEFFENN